MSKKPRYEKEDDWSYSFPEPKIKGFTLTEKQESLINLVKKDNTTITFISGCWGTAKTFTACYVAFLMLKEKKVSKIVLCKPIVESGDPLGFLKGDLSEKTAPYEKSFWSTFEKFVDARELEMLKASKTISFEPITFMRGANIDDSFIILDEAQNFSDKDLNTFVTRLGRNSRMVILGDSYQTDIPEKESGFKTFKTILKGIKGVEYFNFDKTDIKRNPILIEIAERYELYKHHKDMERKKKASDSTLITEPLHTDNAEKLL